MSGKNFKKNNPDGAPSTEPVSSEITIRELAEDIVRKKSLKKGKEPESLSPEASRQLINELEVHQVELEMQNKELRRIQEELAKSREWYLDLYDLAPVGYFTLNDKGFIIEINLTAASMLGLKRNSICNQPFTRFILNEDLDIYYLHQKDLFENGKKQLFELRVKKKNDSLMWLRIETTLAYGEKNILTSRAVMSDITELKKLEEEKFRYEEQIQRNQRLESLGVLAGGIAHNFNNLLSGIFGYIELAERKVNNPEASRFLSEALNMSERAKALTGQLLTFSRGGAPVKKIDHLFPLVKESVNFALSGSDIACRFNIEDNLKKADFDAARISQVIDDVILNARQAMPDGGIVDISAYNVLLSKNEIAPLPEGEYIKISVKDSGSGMPPEIISKIFDPFFTTKSSGHGLGLVTSYSIISRHGGTITVESELKKGSTVNIYLPAVEAEESSQLDTSYTAHHGSGTIIIMDDDECVRDSISEILMSMGYDVIHMEEGGEVITFLKEKHSEAENISGIILDLIIPGGMGGKSAAVEIKKIAPEIPVFAISGCTDDTVMVNPGESSFTASISKPFLMKQLGEMLNKYL